ncbi:efflux transporter outer membrane subunit [Oligoflexus tunisiensis]|uniref:efflux transporter outer membrane subunit n=1 Tax=Oligoflexus tunisiensis TaxID=708132 RepID=UPI000A92B2DD|nr:efflux transporter outer membrane subunit [Oligoflexus tunisiensis]
MKWIPRLSAFGLVSLASCSLNPAYERPSAPIPSSYSYPADSETADSGSQLDDWRQQFTDPGLQKIIEAALKNNRDLRLAALRMEEARALYGVQSAARLPAVNASGTFSRGQQMDPISARPITGSQYQAAVGLTAFELDFFGRVRSLSQAALSQYFATEEAHRAAQISLVADVATTYIRERGLAQQEQLARDTLKSREDAFRLNRSRLEAGVTGVLELRTAEMLTETSRARLAAVRRERAQMQNALRILVGSFDFAFEDNRSNIENVQFPVLHAGIPSSLMERRPDIRQAEHLLLAANANIGAARAAFFPSLSLTSSIGTVSEEFSGLFKNGTEVWNFTPQLNLPIFAGGRNRANLDLAHVRKNIAIIRYEQAIQNAFREVMDTLTARDQLLVQVNAQKAVTDADRERARISQLRYDKGVSNYLEYLDSQRSLFESEQEYLRLHELRLSNDIALYRALGGGWSLPR